MRHLGDTRLLAASMNGYTLLRPQQLMLVLTVCDSDLAVYDTRFPPSRSRGGPLLALEGHSNAYTTSLGFDVYRDNFVALGAALSLVHVALVLIRSTAQLARIGVSGFGRSTHGQQRESH